MTNGTFKFEFKLQLKKSKMHKQKKIFQRIGGLEFSRYSWCRKEKIRLGRTVLFTWTWNTILMSMNPPALFFYTYQWFKHIQIIFNECELTSPISRKFKLCRLRSSVSVKWHRQIADQIVVKISISSIKKLSVFFILQLLFYCVTCLSFSQWYKNTK